MVRECTQQDLPVIFEYLKREPVYNTFLLADIEDFGFETEFQRVYMDLEQGECRGIYLCFYQNFLLYSEQGTINIDFLEQLFSYYVPDVVMGKKENVMVVQRILLDYQLELRGLYLLEETKNLVEEGQEIYQGKMKDVDDIFALLQSIPELKNLYTSKQMIADRIEKGCGVHYLIRDKGKLIAHGNSAAQCAATVMIGGVAVEPKYRGRKLASYIVSRLCREILAKGKQPCLFCSRLEEHNLYYNLGFRRIGDWATLVKPSDEPKKLQETSEKKLPSYLPVYNQLYGDIQAGIYERGSILPSETVLAEKYHVSRNTLRQALTILTQDGYIYKHQGKGTFVSYDRDKKLGKKFYNFLVEDALEQICRIRPDYNIGLPTQIARRKLELSSKDEVLASNNVYESGAGPVGQSFLQIPMQILQEAKVDLNSETELMDFMNEGIYKLAKQAEMSIQLVEADEQVIPYLKVEERTPLLHIEQILFDRERRPIGRIKYYFRSGQYQIQYNL